MAKSLLEHRRQVAQRVADAFAGQQQVAAIIVFGSVANGLVDEYSDVDLLVVTHPVPIPEAERIRLLLGLGDGWATSITTGNALFPIGDIDGIVDDIAVSLHYQQVSWIEEVLRDVLEHGAITNALMPFRPYTLIGLLQRGLLLIDPYQIVVKWREQAKDFPPLLKHNLVQYFMPILKEETAELVGAAHRGLGPANFLFHLNRSVDALIRILYALNEIYDPADRRDALTLWPMLKIAPETFVPRLMVILAGPFDAEGMKHQGRHYTAMVGEVEDLVAKATL